VPGYDKKLYTCERLHCPTVDEEGKQLQIPISIVYRKDKRTPGKPQLLSLFGYGAYGEQ
jgi:oligopeptidase B